MYTVYINNKKIKDFDRGYDLNKIINHYLFVYQNEDIHVLISNSLDRV